jgi:hypothetical protein
VGEFHYTVIGGGDSAYGPVPPKRLSEAAQQFWDYEGLGESTHGVVATSKGKLVGFFRFSLTKDRELIAGGTWVEEPWRKEGLGLRLWLMAINAHKVVSVDVVPVSLAGFGLVRKVQKLCPTTKFALSGRLARATEDSSPAV